MNHAVCCSVFFLFYITGLYAQTGKYHSNDLIPVARFGDLRAIGVSVSSDNRVFVSFPDQGGSYRYGLTEIINEKPFVYPDAEWNRRSGDSTSRFVSVQDLYIDARDNLWVLDSKPAPAGSVFGAQSAKGLKEGYFKLVRIDLRTNKVEKAYLFEDLDKEKSGLNDVQVDLEKGLAYLSDPGQSAIVVLDLASGKTRTVLKKHPSTLADPDIILTYEGKEMRDGAGKPFVSNVNGIALTKDNKYFYYKPINELHLYRIETRFLADWSLTEESLGKQVEDMGETSVTHGLIADTKGNVYLTSSMDYSIKYLSPDGKIHTLVKDSRIIWPDSMGIGTDGFLYFSCAQLNRDPKWNNGKSRIELPYTLFKVRLP